MNDRTYDAYCLEPIVPSGSFRGIDNRSGPGGAGSVAVVRAALFGGIGEMGRVSIIVLGIQQ
jgi:hypothetical protein